MSISLGQDFDQWHVYDVRVWALVRVRYVPRYRYPARGFVLPGLHRHGERLFLSPYLNGRGSL